MPSFDRLIRDSHRRALSHKVPGDLYHGDLHDSESRTALSQHASVAVLPLSIPRFRLSVPARSFANGAKEDPPLAIVAVAAFRAHHAVSAGHRIRIHLDPSLETRRLRQIRNMEICRRQP